MDPLSLEFSFFPHDWDRGGLAWISETFLFYVLYIREIVSFGCYFFRKIFFLWWIGGGRRESFDIAHEREFAAFNNLPLPFWSLGKSRHGSHVRRRGEGPTSFHRSLKTVDFPCERATLTLFNRRNFQRKTCKMLAKWFVCNIFKDMNLLPFWPRRKPRGNNFLLKSAPVRERLSRITFKKIQTRYFFLLFSPWGESSWQKICLTSNTFI